MGYPLMVMMQECQMKLKFSQMSTRLLLIRKISQAQIL